MGKSKRHSHSEEEIKFIKDNYKGKTNKDLAKMFNEKFNTNRTSQHMKSFKSKRGWVGGLDSRFKKGHSPVNKGLFWDYEKETYVEEVKLSNQKKITKSYNDSYPIGSRVERSKKNIIKIGYPSEWVDEHRLVWEVYNDEIPDDHVVMALDGNIKNAVIENLIMIPKKVLLYMTTLGYHSLDDQIKESGAMIAQIMLETMKIEYGEKEHEKNS